MASRNAASTRCRVSGVEATWTETTSAARATSGGVAARVTPCSRADSSVSDRLQATTGIPNARARAAISRPTLPIPSSPSVRPRTPRADAKPFLSHRPARAAITLSGIRRSRARRSPNASSATAAAFLPGQLATNTPRWDAAAVSIVSTPAPARTTSSSDGAASRASAVTRVERTTKTAGSCSRSASTTASPLSPASSTTVCPASRMASRAAGETESATRTVIVKAEGERAKAKGKAVSE